MQKRIMNNAILHRVENAVLVVFFCGETRNSRYFKMAMQKCIMQ